MENRLHLEFVARQLYRTEFHNSSSSQHLICFRNRDSLLPGQSGSFSWTKATIALCVLLLKYKLAWLRGLPADAGMLAGLRPSLATSLDDSLQKENRWLSDMFGCGAAGRLTARSIFKVENPGCKRPGPVLVWCDPRHLGVDRVTLSCDGAAVEGPAEVTALVDSIQSGLKTAPLERSIGAEQSVMQLSV